MTERSKGFPGPNTCYDASSDTSFVLALLTLSPILLMPAYAVLAVQTRELTVINMWAGQFLSEGLNFTLKHIVKAERPADSKLHLNGYGFPSSHSQYMGYFGAFLISHMYFRHRFASYRISLARSALQMLRLPRHNGVGRCCCIFEVVLAVPYPTIK
ncbi:hypothetical protein BU15DRAFT_73838 [Melanogaster broomeanus]|nr:hypothetical protein BU15DRAFT_73838 [Melanogaster broomeanus]